MAAKAAGTARATRATRTAKQRNSETAKTTKTTKAARKNPLSKTTLWFKTNLFTATNIAINKSIFNIII